MINNVTLVGRLTKNPELKTTNSGKSVASFTLAVNRKFTDQNGNREADFIPIVVWNKQAENVAQYCFKGSQVGVEGRLQVRNYQAQDGTTRYVTEVIATSVTFLESKNQDNSNNFQQQDNSNYQSNYNHQQQNYNNAQTMQQDIVYQQQNSNNNFDFNNDNAFEISDDDLPF